MLLRRRNSKSKSRAARHSQACPVTCQKVFSSARFPVYAHTRVNSIPTTPALEQNRRFCASWSRSLASSEGSVGVEPLGSEELHSAFSRFRILRDGKNFESQLFDAISGLPENGPEGLYSSKPSNMVSSNSGFMMRSLLNRSLPWEVSRFESTALETKADSDASSTKRFDGDKPMMRIKVKIFGRYVSLVYHRRDWWVISYRLKMQQNLWKNMQAR